MSLVAEHVSMRFGGLQALADVSSTVERGQVLGLVGPNGAGKSTLFNCIMGIVTPQEGSITIDGTNLAGLRPDQRVRHGIGRSFQTPRLDLDAPLVDAVSLGFYPRTEQRPVASFFATRAVRRQEAELREKAEELIRRFGLAEDPMTRAGDLSLGRLRLLEVARALAGEATYLLLDEPAAGVDEDDRQNLADVIRNAAEDGMGVLLVEHNFGWVKANSDVLTVLVNGKVLATGDPDVVASDPRVVDAYLGEYEDA